MYLFKRACEQQGAPGRLVRICACVFEFASGRRGRAEKRAPSRPARRLATFHACRRSFMIGTERRIDISYATHKYTNARHSGPRARARLQRFSVLFRLLLFLLLQGHGAVARFHRRRVSTGCRRYGHGRLRRQYRLPPGRQETEEIISSRAIHLSMRLAEQERQARYRPPTDGSGGGSSSSNCRSGGAAAETTAPTTTYRCNTVSAHERRTVCNTACSQLTTAD